MGNRTVTITDNGTGKTVELPVYSGSGGDDVIDLAALHKSLGLYTFDPGFTSTASCESKITFIDGEKGVLLYRGYPIEQLATQSNFLEVAYLLLNGELPTSTEYTEFRESISSYSMVNERARNFFQGFHSDAHPMAILSGIMGGVASYYHDGLDVFNPEHQKTVAHRLIAKIPTIAAMSYKRSIGEPFVYPKKRLGFAENFINMMFSTPLEEYELNPTMVDAVDKIFILHADHEQNASTSTVRLSGSSLANPYAAVAAGIATLWGPSHGGANEAVLHMLHEIGDVKNIPKFIETVKDKSNAIRLMGFGHRVYKNYDPRASIIKESADKILSGLKVHDPLLDVAKELESIALKDPYFVEKKLYPNVDFYSGIILKAIGIPLDMFTVIFAIARTVGWITQWQEMISDPKLKIGRPRQLYTGSKTRDYIPIRKR